MLLLGPLALPLAFLLNPPIFCADVGTLHFEDAIAPEGGDYLVIPFTVPAGVVEVQVRHSDESSTNILDWGLWQADGTWRGWGGGNTQDAIVGTTAASRSYVPGPVEGAWELVIGKALLRELPARYVVDITFRDAPTITAPTTAPWTDVTLATGPRWVKGDLHVHSHESGDSRAELAAVADFARARGLDFVVFSDHNTISQHAQLAAMQAAYPDLLFVRGAEMTTYGGHGNSLGMTTYVDHRVGHAGRTARAILEEIATAGGVFVMHHPLLALGDNCIGCQWVHADTPWDKVGGIELVTGPYTFNESLTLTSVVRMWDEQLDAGHLIAAIGGSDDHEAGTGSPTDPYYSPIGSPTTLVYAASLAEADVVRGIREGRTIVNLRGPDDPVVELSIADLHQAADVGGIGDTIAASAVEVTARIVGGDGTTIRLVHDGGRLPAVPVTSADFRHAWQIAVPEGTTRARFRLELAEEGKRIVITSHAFATHEDGPGLPPPDGAPAPDGGTDAMGTGADGGGGCGCVVAGRRRESERGTSTAWLIAALALALARRASR